MFGLTQAEAADALAEGVSSDVGRLSSDLMQRSIAMGVVYIICGAFITNFTLAHRDENLCDDRNFQWLYVEGICLCVGGSVCWLNALVTLIARRDAADSHISSGSVRLIQATVCLNGCQRCFTQFFHCIWILWGGILFFFLSEDLSVGGNCGRLAYMGSGIVAITCILYIIFGFLHWLRGKRVGRSEDRV